MSTIERLLRKIELDLEKAVNDGGEAVNADGADETDIYRRRTLVRLREMGVEITAGEDVANIREAASRYEDIFAECYHKLLELEKTRALTTGEVPLLNDLDEFEDYLIRE